MLYTAVLIAHIGGGIATIIFGLYTGVALWNGTIVRYQSCALTLAGLALYEILSGAVLGVVSTQITTRTLCINIAVYLFCVFCLEALLFSRGMRASTRSTRSA